VIASFLSRRGQLLRLAALCAAAAAPSVASADPPTFEEAFRTLGEPPALHYQVAFLSKGAEHRLEVWRDGDLRVKRATDAALETYGFHERGGEEFRLSVLDTKRRIHTRIHRTNLYRLGNFTDWFDLTHGLKHPRAGYRLARTGAPQGSPRPLARCQWYELTQDRRVTRICWSPRDRIPLLIQGDDGGVIWRVTAVDRAPIPAATFVIHDEGFVRNDADADVEGD
jgi:hypothetical protein